MPQLLTLETSQYRIYTEFLEPSRPSLFTCKNTLLTRQWTVPCQKPCKVYVVFLLSYWIAQPQPSCEFLLDEVSRSFGVKTGPQHHTTSAIFNSERLFSVYPFLVPMTNKSGFSQNFTKQKQKKNNLSCAACLCSHLILCICDKYIVYLCNTDGIYSCGIRMMLKVVLIQV